MNGLNRSVDNKMKSLEGDVSEVKVEMVKMRDDMKSMEQKLDKALRILVAMNREGRRGKRERTFSDDSSSFGHA